MEEASKNENEFSCTCWKSSICILQPRKKFHNEPSVLHYGEKGTGEKIREGMIFTIEPMINAGNYETKTLNDGWTAVTKDKSLSAQFEHTIGVTKNGYEIFTLSKEAT